VPRTVICT
jgi:hypothetical protein